MTWTLRLEQRRDDDGLLHRSLTLTDDDALVLRGHDVGAGVSKVFGAGRDEYEFVASIDRAGVLRLREVMGLVAGDDLRTALEARFAVPGGAHAYQALLKEHDIPTEFWNHIGGG